ncbi:MAG TPA: anti-sigma factor, partial [Isosphaeraceae bacterium]|nr:anti-sigma factor [Isosphaeraceae bacterium]
LGTAKGRIRTGLRALRLRLAPLFATCLIAAMLLALLLPRILALRSDLRRDEAALRLVTSSDVVPLRLVAAPGTPAMAHGNYRGRPGVPMAVLTLSHLAPAPAGRAYRAWGNFQGRWFHLGAVHPDDQGRDLLIVEGPHLATTPTALSVTLEPVGAPPTRTAPPVIIWPGP